MPNHLNHWQAIQWAKARGCTVYDMWGVPEGTRESESQDEDAKLPEGLYRFKMGFGGAFKEYLGAWDFVLSPALYALFARALKIRRRLTTR
jgi:lipid II:glycine glycyltransferase (peptidoglycan interpeptide bridge formation enzyme)